MAISVNITGEVVQLSGNPIEIECTGGSVPDGATNYKILLNINSEDGNLVGAPIELAKTPDDDGAATFDISGYVDQPVTPEFQYPVSGDYVAHPLQSLKINVQAGEYWMDEDGLIHEEFGSESETIQILKGGTNPRQNAKMRDEGISFYSLYIQGNRFLTTRQWGETVHSEQDVKLWYMVAESASATLKITVSYGFGVTDTYTSSAISMSPDNVYEFNCNPFAKGIDLTITDETYGELTAEFYDVTLDFGGSESETRRFYVYQDYIERPLFFFFANSLGGVDDVFLHGYIKGSFESESTVVERPALTSDTVFDATLYESGKTGQDGWTVNTGWKPVSTMPYFRDFLLSRRVWFLYANVDPMDFLVIPVIIEAGSFDLYERKENLFNMDIAFVEAHKSPYIFDHRVF